MRIPTSNISPRSRLCQQVTVPFVIPHRHIKLFPQLARNTLLLPGLKSQDQFAISHILHQLDCPDRPRCYPGLLHIYLRAHKQQLSWTIKSFRPLPCLTSDRIPRRDDARVFYLDASTLQNPSSLPQTKVRIRLVRIGSQAQAHYSPQLTKSYLPHPG